MTRPLNTHHAMVLENRLHNLLHCIALRADPHAQYKIRAYALLLLDVAKVPLTHDAFVNYRLERAERFGQSARGGPPQAAGSARANGGSWRPCN